MCQLGLSVGDFDCVCNYNVETGVYDHPNNHGTPIGYMYEFDCKPIGDGKNHGNFEQIMFEHQVSICLIC